MRRWRERRQARRQADGAWVKAVKTSGLYGDGGGLYLKGARRLQKLDVRWSDSGKVRKHGLGPTHTVD